MKIFRSYFLPVLLFFISISSEGQKNKNVKPAAPGQVWSIEKANEWYSKQPFINGANFIPSTAINQLEMWQAETFDSATIDRELKLAEDIGFNTMRVYLHSVAWTADAAGFKKRLDTYLGIAGKHGIRTIFVLFDDVWNKDPRAGVQPTPKPGIHNSGWMQDPGQAASSDSTRFPALEKYVKDVLRYLKDDKRVLLWDLYNEPGNSGKGDSTLSLLKSVFRWARDVNPSQPVSAGLWDWELDSVKTYQFLNSDVITYHDYNDPVAHQRVIDILKATGRPLICTEYMARTRNSRFFNILPLLKKENVGAINWGFVEGKTNTIYAWDTPVADGSQPDEWFHDIFFRNGKPYSDDEVNLIKKINNKK
jgi:endo-1,4-beta-mannosidase